MPKFLSREKKISIETLAIQSFTWWNSPLRGLCQTYSSVYRPCTFPISRTITALKRNHLSRAGARYSKWQTSRLAQLLETFPSSSDCKVILYAGVTRAMEVPGRLATGERTSVPENFRTLYRTGENPSVPRLSHLRTNLEGEKERENPRDSFSVYRHRVDISRVKYMGRALTMHFHVSGKSAHAERIDAGGSCGRHAIRCE